MHPSRRKPAQLRLFSRPDGSDPPSTPPWKSLPSQTRRRATALLTQLFLEHLRYQPGEAPREEDSDDV